MRTNRQIERLHLRCGSAAVRGSFPQPRRHCTPIFELEEAAMNNKELLALGMFGSGSRLGDRIEMLLERGRDFSPRTSLNRVGASAVALVGGLIGGAFTPRLIAFAQATPQFEVASVKPTDPNANEALDLVVSPGGRLKATIL